jgi:virginiamycin B lyase
MVITADGMVWYSESGVTPNTIIRFNPKTEEFARANIPSGGGTVRNMAATQDGRIYLACSGVNKVGVVEPLR